MDLLYKIPSLYYEDTLSMSFMIAKNENRAPRIDVLVLRLPESQELEYLSNIVFWKSLLRIDYATKKPITQEESAYKSRIHWMENTIPTSTDFSVRCVDPGLTSDDCEWEEEGYWSDICDICEFDLAKVDDNIQYLKIVLSVYRDSLHHTFADISSVKVKLKDSTKDIILFEYEIDMNENNNDTGSFLCLKREIDNTFALYKDENCALGGISEYINNF